MLLLLCCLYNSIAFCLPISKKFLHIGHGPESDFNPDSFEHIAIYNKIEQKIEMFLRAINEMVIVSPYFKNNRLILKKDETIHTENSNKYSRDHITNMAVSSGLKVQNIFTDTKKWFFLVQFIK